MINSTRLALNPRFLGAGDVRLRPDSPLIDRGVPIPGINDAFLGTAPDLGAFEAGTVPAAPSLYITNTAPGFATIWWTPPTPGFVLQSTDSLAPTNWGNAPNGTNNPAAVPATLPARFYRLFKSGS